MSYEELINSIKEEDSLDNNCTGPTRRVDPLYRRRVQNPITGEIEWDESSMVTADDWKCDGDDGTSEYSGNYIINAGKTIIGYNVYNQPLYDTSKRYDASNLPKLNSNNYFSWDVMNISLVKAMIAGEYTRVNGFEKWLDNGHTYTCNTPGLSFDGLHDYEHDDILIYAQKHPHDDIVTECGIHIEVTQFYVAQEYVD